MGEVCSQSFRIEDSPIFPPSPFAYFKRDTVEQNRCRLALSPRGQEYEGATLAIHRVGVATSLCLGTAGRQLQLRNDLIKGMNFIVEQSEKAARTKRQRCPYHRSAGPLRERILALLDGYLAGPKIRTSRLRSDHPSRGQVSVVRMAMQWCIKDLRKETAWALKSGGSCQGQGSERSG